MCWRIFLVGVFLVMCLAVVVSNGLGHLRGVKDGQTEMMRNLSRAVLLYHREVGLFLEPIAKEQTLLLEQKFGAASSVVVSEIDHTGAKGFVFANVTRNGRVHKETIMFGGGTVWYVSSDSAPDLP
jgi:hypothetical protein